MPLFRRNRDRGVAPTQQPMGVRQGADVPARHWIPAKFKVTFHPSGREVTTTAYPYPGQAIPFIDMGGEPRLYVYPDGTTAMTVATIEQGRYEGEPTLTDPAEQVGETFSLTQEGVNALAENEVR